LIIVRELYTCRTRGLHGRLVTLNDVFGRTAYGCAQDTCHSCSMGRTFHILRLLELLLVVACLVASLGPMDRLVWSRAPRALIESWLVLPTASGR